MNDFMVNESNAGVPEKSIDSRMSTDDFPSSGSSLHRPEVVAPIKEVFGEVGS